MEIKKVIEHTCFQLEKGAVPDKPLSPKKCRCRQRVTAEEAAIKVTLGVAQYIVVVERESELDDACPVCGALDAFRKTCKQCGGTGVVKIKKTILVRGEDIISTVSEDGKKNTTTTQVKKSPTIEKAHIERAFVSGNKEEQERIELYGELNFKFLNSLISGYEPEDNQKTGTGRRFDYGRSV